MDYRDVCGAIVSGKIKVNDFDAIRQAMNHAVQLRSEFIRVGDIVKFNLNAKPKYLFGVTAEVVKVNRETFKIKMLQGAGRFSKYGIVKTPKKIVDLV